MHWLQVVKEGSWAEAAGTAISKLGCRLLDASNINIKHPQASRELPCWHLSVLLLSIIPLATPLTDCPPDCVVELWQTLHCCFHMLHFQAQLRSLLPLLQIDAYVHEADAGGILSAVAGTCAGDSAALSQTFSEAGLTALQRHQLRTFLLQVRAAHHLPPCYAQLRHSEAALHIGAALPEAFCASSARTFCRGCLLAFFHGCLLAPSQAMIPDVCVSACRGGGSLAGSAQSICSLSRHCQSSPQLRH